jgi:hypothetical protein
VIRLLFEVVFWWAALVFAVFAGVLTLTLIRDRLRFRAVQRESGQKSAVRMDRLAREAFERESAEVTELERIARL